MYVLCYLVLAVCSFFSCCAQDAHCLVYVYLGKELPAYLEYTVAQARLFNKQCAMYCIINESACEDNAPLLKKISQMGCAIITAESLPKSEAHASFDALYEKYPAAFNNNLYWKFTTERFFCVHELMMQYNLKQVFQIECDVLLYVSLQQYMHLFNDYYYGIACPFQNDQVASVSCTYFSDVESMQSFIDFIITTLDGTELIYLKYPDMRLLAAYKNCFPERVHHLPTLTSELIFAEPLTNGCGQSSSRIEQYCNQSDQWDSIFDTDNISVFLEVGFWGAPLIIFNPCAYEFTWTLDQEQRWVLHAVENITGEKHAYRVNTLHIQHKNRIQDFLSFGPRPSFPAK